MLLTLKRAEDGNGFILRLVETEGKEALVSIAIPLLSIRRAYEANLVEENQRLLPCMAHAVRVGVKPFAIVTVRLVIA
jgi:alpha-mannosidase